MEAPFLRQTFIHLLRAFPRVDDAEHLLRLRQPPSQLLGRENAFSLKRDPAKIIEQSIRIGRKFTLNERRRKLLE